MRTTRLGRLFASSRRRAAYSFASSTSWIEHGPTMTMSLSLSPRRTDATWARDFATVRFEASLMGISALRSAGWTRGSIWLR